MKSRLFFISIIFLVTILFAKAQIINIPGDQPTIQAGIDVAMGGDTVLVDEGTYYENINYNGKAIIVASHFIMDGDSSHINNTIINGSQALNPDYGSVVSFVTGEDTTSVISGFTITGGSGMIEPAFSARIGGGIVCYYSTARISHNKIIENELNSSSYAWGGGVYIFTETDNDWVIIENNIISSNQAIAEMGIAEGGGLVISCNALIIDNIIANNQINSPSGDADGGGIYQVSLVMPADTLILENNWIGNNIVIASNLARGGGVASFASYCLVRNNTFYNNELDGYTTVGCGMFIRDGVFTEITGNAFNQNTVYPENNFLGVGCASIFPAGPIHIENNEFYANTGPLEASSSSGGGLQIWDAFSEEVTVTRNTFISNAARFGGGFYSRSCYNLSVTNNLFSGNVSNDGGGVGMYIPASSEDMNPEFINNTFVNNIANFNGGAAHFNCETNLPVLFNCIFDTNFAPTGNDISFVGSSNPIVIAFSDFDPNNIVGSWTGEGNINEDPGFIVGDTLFHLSLTSPCKNAGIDSLDVEGTVYYAPLVDYDGEGRPDPLYHMVDMGADENWEVPTAPVALNPETIGVDYFIARWQNTLLATGYCLDVAYDEDFTQIVPGYNNRDVGSDTTWVVTGLGSFPYYYRLRSYNTLYTSGNSNTITVLETSAFECSARNINLTFQIFPNPARGTISLNYSLPSAVRVSICIYDLKGDKISTLVDEELDNGEHSFQKDFSFLPEGLYLVRMQAGQQSVMKKLIIM